MKKDTYYMFENGKLLHFSGSLDRLIRFTVDTENAEIFYNGKLIYVQNTENYYNNRGVKL